MIELSIFCISTGWTIILHSIIIFRNNVYQQFHILIASILALDGTRGFDVIYVHPRVNRKADFLYNVHKLVKAEFDFGLCTARPE